MSGSKPQKLTPLERISEHCKENIHEDCPGTSNDGIWHFNDPILEAKREVLLELAGFDDVYCPCECHKKKS